jgi:hypothetical protein
MAQPDQHGTLMPEHHYFCGYLPALLIAEIQIDLVFTKVSTGASS